MKISTLMLGVFIYLFCISSCIDETIEKAKYPIPKVEIIDSVNYVLQYFNINNGEYPFHIITTTNKNGNLEKQAKEILQSKFNEKGFVGYVLSASRKYKENKGQYFTVFIERYRVNSTKNIGTPEGCELVFNRRIIKNANVAVFKIHNNKIVFDKWRD